MKIDGHDFHKVQAAIPINQVYIISGSFPRPSSGDHKIKLDMKMPAKGFFDSIVEEFNITKHGPFVLCEVTETKLNDGSYESNISFAQQNQPFTFDEENVGEKKKN